jgi:membrane protein implicated in regulation of membrane protease activity
MAHLTSPGEYLKGLGGGALIAIVIACIVLAIPVLAILAALGPFGLILFPIIGVFSCWLAKRNQAMCKPPQ